MKKLFFLLSFVLLLTSTEAQNKRYGGSYYRPRAVITYNPFYSYYGSGLYGYPYYNNYGYPARPTKLQLTLEDISNEYRDKIWSVRQDKNLNGKERREKIRELKHQRDIELDETKSNYYKR